MDGMVPGDLAEVPCYDGIVRGGGELRLQRPAGDASRRRGAEGGVEGVPPTGDAFQIGGMGAQDGAALALAGAACGRRERRHCWAVIGGLQDFRSWGEQTAGEIVDPQRLDSRQRCR